MSVNNEVYEINAEHALYDVIDFICKYLKAKDLSNMAKVCKSWREAALREKGIRCYDQQFCFPYDIDNLANRLDITPYASLLVYDSKLEKLLSIPADDYWSNSTVLENFKAQLPNKTIALKVDMCLSTEDAEFQVENVQRNVRLAGNCEILGLFFPSMEGRVRVDVAWVSTRKLNLFLFLDPTQTDQLCNENPQFNWFAKDLGLHDCEDPKVTILLFTTGDYTKTLKQLRKRRDGQTIVWAGIWVKKLAAGNHGENDGRNNLQSSVALRFSGPSVDSCSTFIYIHASRDEIERKLQKLKEQVTRKKHYVGLIYSLNCVKGRCGHLHHPSCNSREMMNNLKIIFPDIPFKGFYINQKIPDYANWFIACPDRSNAKHAFDKELLKNLKYYTSIIIISYD